MKKLRLLALAAAASCIAVTAQASMVVLNFDKPGIVDVNPDDSQTLVEGAYALNGPLFSFQPIDNAGNGAIVGDGSLFTLQQVGGGIFSLRSLDYALDPIFGETAGNLSVVGLFNGLAVATLPLSLGPLVASAMFDDSWRSLTSVTFSGTPGFSIDNVAVVPEPGSLALIALGLGALVASGRRSGAARAA